MEQVKYQGYARDRGFNPIQVSTGSVDAIAQQGNALVRQMRDNQGAESRNRGEYLSALSDKNQQEAQNRSSNFEFSQRSRAKVEQGNLNNLQQKAKNFEVQSQRTANALAPLAGLSQTVGKLLIDWQNKKNEDERAQGWRDRMLNGPDPQAAAAVEAGVAGMRKSHELIQGTADKLEDSGAAPEAVRAVRKMSKWYQIGDTQARAQMAAMQYGGWLEQQYQQDTETVINFKDPTTNQVIPLTPQTAMGPDQRAAVNSVLFRKFLQQNDLLNVNPELVQESILAMKKQENQLLERERDQFIKASNQEEVDRTIFRMQAGLAVDPVTAVNEAMANLRHLQDENGVRLSPLKAFNVVVDRLVGMGNIEALDAFAQSESYMPGKTWEDLRGVEFNQARRKITAQTQADEDMRDREVDQEFQNWSDERIQALYNEGAVDSAIVEQLIDQSKQFFNGRVDKRLEEYRDNSTLQARTEQEQEKEIRALYEKGEWTVAEAQSGKFSQAILDKGNWKQKAADNDKILSAISGPSRDVVKKSISSALIMAAGYEGENAVKAPSYYFAESHAMRRVEALAQTYTKAGDDPQAAYEKAAQDIIKEIASDNSREGNKRKFGTYTFNDNEFTRWGVQSSGGQGSLTKATADINRVINTVVSGGQAAVFQRELLTKQQAQSLDDMNAPVPAIVQVIADKLPKGKSMSVYEIIDAQRTYHGLPPRQRPYAQQVVDSQVSPEFRELLNRMPTAMRTSRALTGSGMIGPGQERQAIQKIAANLGVDPVEVATFINYETGGNLANGQYRRGLDRWGGDGGRYLGWIQFSPDNQRKYGVTPGMDPMQMADAVSRYLKDSGIRAGDGLEAMYQAIQAPALMDTFRRTGRLQGADSNDSVDNHVRKMRAEHRGVASNWLSQGATSAWRDPRLMSSAANKAVRRGMNRGIQITSANDASGEPGSDFVVDNGRRGADFYFPYKARVVKVVGNDNREFNLEKGAKGRGYGNYVDLEVVLPGGEKADVRLAHFDGVDGSLKEGMTLPPGALIGQQGRTGSTTGAHISADWYYPGTNKPHTKARDIFLQQYLRKA